MRPIKLEMQAFGPFKDKITIPFDNLGMGNIYLISGVTGSGKTTIFDAICYALFNSSSGSIRGNASLRSHFASEDIESYVKFDFLFNNEMYSILRHPSYERKKTRGEGFILEQSKAQILLPDGKIIEKTKEVDEYIKNLLGLDVVQFSQIALLAQGEFLKLLNADTQSRAEVFRNIFKTWSYADFQNKLKDKMICLKNKYQNLENMILQHISNVSLKCEKLSELTNKYLQNACFDSLDEYILLLKMQNDDDSAILESIKKEIIEIEKDISLAQSEFQKIQNKITIQKQIEKLLLEEKVLQDDFKKSEDEFKNIPNLKKESEDILLEIQKTKDEYEKIIEANKLIKNKSEVQEQKNKLDKSIGITKEKIECLKYNYLQAVFYQINDLESQLKISQDDFLKFQKIVQDKNKKYDLEYNEYLKIQAGIIAKTLKENEPCPVCGSKAHPVIAKLENENLTKEYIDELKFEIEKLNVDLFAKTNNCSLLKEKIKSKEDLFKSLLKKFDIKQADLSPLKPNEIDYEQEINDNQMELDKKINNQSELLQFLVSLDSKIELLTQNKTSNDINLILKNHEDLNSKYTKIKNLIDDIEKEYNSKNILINNLKTKIKLLEEQLNALCDISVEKITQIEVEISKYKENMLNLDKKTEEIISRKSINEKMLQEILSKNKEFNKISADYENYKILSDCANGTLKGKVRIPFEQYIQSYYLDLVLYEANKRLKIMTHNQFQLFRKNDSFALNSKAGLDLEVMDYHTFKKRSTKTLSGGESFKAALALALGLSDCVSNFSGAINIDAMFIDEGFGSLDNESLELAMDVVFNLSSNNRLIGLISHIEELKSKIQNQIIVNKSQNGSSVEINF